MAMASTATTILPSEAAHFGTLAADWWNPKGSSAMLHKLNPVRLGFVRQTANTRCRLMIARSGRLWVKQRWMSDVARG